MDVQDDDGQEPLHVAAIEGHSDLVLDTWSFSGSVLGREGFGADAAKCLERQMKGGLGWLGVMLQK